MQQKQRLKAGACSLGQSNHGTDLPRAVVQPPQLEVFITRADKDLSSLACPHRSACLKNQAEPDDPT